MQSLCGWNPDKGVTKDTSVSSQDYKIMLLATKSQDRFSGPETAETKIRPSCSRR